MRQLKTPFRASQSSETPPWSVWPLIGRRPRNKFGDYSKRATKHGLFGVAQPKLTAIVSLLMMMMMTTPQVWMFINIISTIEWIN
jgi:hypothetical protein